MALTFPSSVLLDDFNRANGAPGANWLDNIFAGLPTMAITSNQLKASAAFQSNYWATQFPSDQEAWYTDVLGGAADGVGHYLMIRLRNPASGNEYGYQLTLGTGNTYIEKFVAGVPSTLQNTGIEIAAGEKVGLRAVGNVVSAWRDTGSGWAQFGTDVIDTGVVGAGFVGLRQGNTSAPTYDNFGGGSLGGAPLAGEFPHRHFGPF